MAQLQIALAQINSLVGDIEANTQLILAAMAQARAEQADLVLFPELALVGYPPEDLLYRDDLYARVELALQRIEAACHGLVVVLGVPWRQASACYNAAVVLGQAERYYYAKQCLPNYQVFDEKRYFTPGEQACVITIQDLRCAITICEDIWHPEPIAQAKAQGAELVLNLNASPFHIHKLTERRQVLAERAQQVGLPIVYVNLVGGQDELVFDGGSMLVDALGQVCFQAPTCQPALSVLPWPQQQAQAPVVAEASEEAQVYQALVLAVRDYVSKNGFKGAVVGSSGGIDSALTLAIAVDALGADKVEAVMMPSQYTASISSEDAAEQAQRQGFAYQEIAIGSLFAQFLGVLAEPFAGLPVDTTEENLQARIRGVLLMALSNKKGRIVLTTGNKSEMAVGYATLYGDMAGGFAVLKDVPKTLVYRLARYRNQSSDGPVIPERIITRPPSAELRPDQKDSDSLPDYDTLDAILADYVEHDLSFSAIVEKGFDERQVRQVLALVDRNEYKRRQSAPGAKITRRAFGRERRYPITSGFGRYRNAGENH